MITTFTRRPIASALIIVLFGVLIILGSGLKSVHFHPGKPIPRVYRTSPVAHNFTPAPPSTTLIDIFRILILTLSIGGGVIGAIGAILSPEFRRFLLRQLVPAGVILLAIYLLSLFIHPFKHVPIHVSPRPAPAPTLAQPPSVQVPMPAGAPSHWWGILIALGAALLVVGTGMFAWRLITGWRMRKATADDVLRKLGKQADTAVSRLRAGDDPRAVVLLCYKEMCNILHKYGHVANQAYFTPREFANQLHARGMSHAHADRLTTIFEQVRYGNRQGSQFAREASTCLDAIRNTYAPSG